ncbi:uncharacterized protein LOC120156599 [Hibiscus syriacus]|uniref:uncharacterized protein LOC120156599 n=1 Tax=Hibiscus syriacus TaxID=106335 RepID=UPI001920AD34|nr:uncharacterized protein LOC120156599 [Hibiscus syriacus]
MATDFTRFCFPHGLLHLPPLLFCRFILSVSTLLLHNPHFTSRCLILSLFTQDKSSISMLKTPLDVKEAKPLVRVECGVLMAMLVMQLLVLALSCAVHHCWVREYEGLEAERESTAKKQSRRLQRVQEESMANAARIAEFKAKEFDEKMKSKYCQG